MTKKNIAKATPEAENAHLPPVRSVRATEDVWYRAKQKAAAERLTLQAFFSKALEWYIDLPDPAHVPPAEQREPAQGISLAELRAKLASPVPETEQEKEHDICFISLKVVLEWLLSQLVPGHEALVIRIVSVLREGKEFPLGVFTGAVTIAEKWISSSSAVVPVVPTQSKRERPPRVAPRAGEANRLLESE